jgi:dTDP-4-dehydrorhamnose 3,5-epimerase-like enzyme
MSSHFPSSVASNNCSHLLVGQYGLWQCSPDDLFQPVIVKSVNEATESAEVEIPPGVVHGYEASMDSKIIVISLDKLREILEDNSLLHPEQVSVESGL